MTSLYRESLNQCGGKRKLKLLCTFRVQQHPCSRQCTACACNFFVFVVIVIFSVTDTGECLHWTSLVATTIRYNFATFALTCVFMGARRATRWGALEWAKQHIFGGRLRELLSQLTPDPWNLGQRIEIFRLQVTARTCRHVASCMPSRLNAALLL